MCNKLSKNIYHVLKYDFTSLRKQTAYNKNTLKFNRCYIIHYNHQNIYVKYFSNVVLIMIKNVYFYFIVLFMCRLYIFILIL